jgi:cytochrome c2
MSGSRSQLCRRVCSQLAQILWAFVVVAISCFNSAFLLGGELDPTALRPGIVERMWMDDPADGAASTRIVPRPLWYAARISATASSPRTPIRIAWSGALEAPSAGEYRFAVVTSGKLSLRIGSDEHLLQVPACESLADGHGRTVGELQWSESPTLSITADWHTIELQFEGDARDAHVTFYWQGPGFDWEPLPSQYLAHDARDRAVSDQHLGRLLFQELRCGACHSTSADPVSGDPVSAAPVSADPVSADPWSPEQTDLYPAPALDKLRGNLRRDWLVNWLSGGEASAASAHGDLHGRRLGNERSAAEDSDDELEPTDLYRLDRPLVRRMPHFAIDRDAAEAIADYLDVETPRSADGPQAESMEDTGEGMVSDKRAKANAGRDTEVSAKSTAGGRGGDALQAISAGERITHARGCLACHSIQGVGQRAGVGGDLSRVGQKRPRDFFPRWLTNPAQLNRDHRMPVFAWQATEVAQVSAYLMSLGASQESTTAVAAPAADPHTESAVHPVAAPTAAPSAAQPLASQAQRGQQLFERFRCAACHRGPDDVESPRGRQPELLLRGGDSSVAGCHALAAPATATTQPFFDLNERQRHALQQYLAITAESAAKASMVVRSPLDQLHRLNCVGCHERGEARGMRGHVGSITQRLAVLADEADALVPPTLNAVGDKLHRAALVDVLNGSSAARRPWLAVRMPRFPIGADQVDRLADAMIAADRVPSRQLRQAGRFRWEDLREDRGDEPTRGESDVASRAAGITDRITARHLVTSEGFGCVSCHQIGPVKPANAAPGTRGPRLANARTTRPLVMVPAVRASAGADIPSTGDAVDSDGRARAVERPARSAT